MLYLCMTYPLSFRERVISYIDEGGSRASASRLFKISHDTIHRWWRDRDNLSPSRERPKHAYKLDREKLVKLVDANPDIMLKELASHLGVSVGSVFHSLRVLGYTRKKNGTLQREKAL